MKDSFYRHFEMLFRGERAEIKERLHVYSPFINPLAKLYPDAVAIDLGCGRGEWLELLREEGFQGVGVDLDDGMLEDCRSLGLDVKTQDAISALRSLADESASIVSAFHLVEHIPFDDLRTLVSEAHRVLKPGGILVLETPNPENLTVATSSFYLDPTHTRPIPPGLLSFIPKYYGFARHTVLRLQESPKLINKQSPSLMNVLEGVSPDYAVIAQKFADESIQILFDDAFNLDLGLTINTLSKKYDQATQRSFIQDREAIEGLKSQLSEDSRKNRESIALLQFRTGELRSEFDEVSRKNREAIEQLQSQAAWLKAEIDSIYNSRSWKITGPLRWLGRGLRRLQQIFLR